MKKLEVKLEIYFLTDVLRNKFQKNYLKGKDENFSLKQISFDDIPNNRDKIIYLYCVWNLLKAWESQRQWSISDSIEKKNILL